MYRILVLVFTITVGGIFALPTITSEGRLLRPSPINPDIPMEPKPADRITKITDPVEAAKFKRENDRKELLRDTLNGPTKVPNNEKVLHRQKRVDHSTTTVAASSEAGPYIGASQAAYIQHTLPAEIPVSVTEFAKPVSPLQKGESVQNTARRVRRDIPVPLVPKYHHPEESPKEEDKKPANKEEKPDAQAKKSDANTESSAEKKTEKRTTDEEKTATPPENAHQLVEHNTSEKPSKHEHLHREHLSQSTSGHHSFQPEHPHNTVHHTTESSRIEEIAPSSTVGSVQPTVTRHRPVPVSELFGRLKNAQEKHQQQQAEKENQKPQKNKEQKKKDDDADSSEEDD